MTSRGFQCCSTPGGWAESQTADERIGFAKGDAVYRQGDPGLFWLEALVGMVRSVRLSPDGRRQLIGFWVPGDIFGPEQGFYRSSIEVVI